MKMQTQAKAVGLISGGLDSMFATAAAAGLIQYFSRYRLAEPKTLEF